MNADGEALLCIRGLTKRYGVLEALRSLDLDVREGEVHGLVGANGSGKTTLLNILFGNPVIARTGGYGGRVLLDGVEVSIASPAGALALGIGMVHQEFALIPGMTVTENIRLGRESTYTFTERLFGRNLAAIRRDRDEALAAQALLQVGVEPCGRRLVRDLSPSLRPFVEIAREIDRGQLKLLLLDEPTAALNSADVERFCEISREIAAGGTAIVYVSHRLEEVAAVSDRMTVLAEGRVVRSFEKPEYDLAVIAECMTGRSVIKVRRPVRRTERPVLMRIENMHAAVGGERLSGADLEIRQGEILGIAGLPGHGKLAFGPGVMGVVPTSGRVIYRGTVLKERTPAGMLTKGVCCLPDDRNQAGLLPDHSIEENLAFTAVQARGRFVRFPRLSGLSPLDDASTRAYAEECVAHFRVKCRSIRQKVSELSGGNQQKVCFGRILAVRPELLLAAEPTRGVDIEAREILLRMLLDLNHETGMTLAIASSDLDELKRICDRIAVVCRGRVTEILDPGDDDGRFMMAFSGMSGNSQ